MSKNMRSHNWALTLRGHTAEECCEWEADMERYVDDKTFRFVAYHIDTCLETGAPCCQAFCVFPNQVRVGTVVALFPLASCVPMHGMLSHDTEYCSKQASFTKLGVEPAQGKRKDLGDVVGVERKKRKTQAGLSKNDISNKDSERIVDDLKKQLETSKKETKEAQRISEDLETQLDVAACTIINQFRQAFISEYGNISGTLEKIYAFQPPLRKDAKLVIQKYNSQSIMKALQSAKLHYHPDKQAGGGYWCQTICMEITKFLNYIQGEVVIRPYARWS